MHNDDVILDRALARTLTEGLLEALTAYERGEWPLLEYLDSALTDAERLYDLLKAASQRALRAGLYEE